ncbi:MAG: response regulator [Sulfurimonas sp.]
MQQTTLSYMNDLYLLIIILLGLSMLFGYLYFMRKIKELRGQLDKEISQSDSSAQTEELPSRTLTQEREEKREPAAEPETGIIERKTIPPVIREPFEETKSITVDDFHNFMGAKLLVAEDNKINQKILLSVLKRSGIIITLADNGQEALDHLHAEPGHFDLVLMDINMPVMDGFVATEKIRADHRFDTLPIVTFTAYTMGKEIEKMYELGVNGHMTKPLNINQLYTLLHTFLSRIEGRELPMIDKLNMQGLDVNLGISLADGDEKHYQQSLREFIFLYKGLIDSMPYWIEENNYDRIKVNLSKISAKLSSVGAHELDELVSRMKKIFIYGNEHRIHEFKDPFVQKLDTLIKAMKSYLQEVA